MPIDAYSEGMNFVQAAVHSQVGPFGPLFITVSIFLFAFSSLQYGPKTGPDLYRAAARSLGSAPERTVVFEDALHAARSAKRAGFLVAGVYDPSAEEDQEALRCLCDWYLPRLDSPDFLAALERG